MCSVLAVLMSCMPLAAGRGVCKALQLYGMCPKGIAVHTCLRPLTKVGGAANALNLLLGVPKVVLELTAVQAEAVPDAYS